MKSHHVVGGLVIAIAIVFGLVSINAPGSKDSLDVGDPSGPGVSQLVGRLLLPMIVAIVGAWILQGKTNRRR